MPEHVDVINYCIEKMARGDADRDALVTEFIEQGADEQGVNELVDMAIICGHACADLHETAISHKRAVVLMLEQGLEEEDAEAIIVATQAVLDDIAANAPPHVPNYELDDAFLNDMARQVGMERETIDQMVQLGHVAVEDYVALKGNMQSVVVKFRADGAMAEEDIDSFVPLAITADENSKKIAASDSPGDVFAELLQPGCDPRLFVLTACFTKQILG